MANTVSLDVARRLKVAGLVWEPKVGDWFLMWLPADKRYLPKPELYDMGFCYVDGEDIWLPGLRDILSRLEELKYTWLMEWPSLECEERHVRLYKDYKQIPKLFDGDTPEDAAGLALIWALGQRGGGNSVT